MKKLCSFIFAFYKNQGMFIRQKEEWSLYPDEIKDDLEIIVTDDCSMGGESLLEVLPYPEKISGRAFYLQRKVPWNWLACRNIGAKYACGKWLVLTDIDHLLQKEHAIALVAFLKANPDPKKVYLFDRIDAPNNTPYKRHKDSFLMTKSMFWRIGGYDEELSGNYGTSGRYRKRVTTVAGKLVELDIPLTRYPREVIPDASTSPSEYVRKGPGRDAEAIPRILKKKKLEGREGEIRLFSFPYKEIM